MEPDIIVDSAVEIVQSFLITHHYRPKSGDHASAQQMLSERVVHRLADGRVVYWSDGFMGLGAGMRPVPEAVLRVLEDMSADRNGKECPHE